MLAESPSGVLLALWAGLARRIDSADLRFLVSGLVAGGTGAMA